MIKMKTYISNLSRNKKTLYAILCLMILERYGNNVLALKLFQSYVWKTGQNV